MSGFRETFVDKTLLNSGDVAPFGVEEAASASKISKGKPTSHRLRGSVADSYDRLMGNRSLLNGPRSKVHDVFRSDGPVSVITQPRDPSTIGPGQEISREVLQRRLATPAELSDWIPIEDLITIELKANGDIVLRAKTHDPQKTGNKSSERTVSALARTLQYAVPVQKMIREGHPEHFNFLAALLGAHLISDLDMELTIRGAENITPGQKVIYVPTHGSMGEIPLECLIARLVGHSVGFVAKRELEKVPGIGGILLGLDQMILIDRHDPSQAWQAMKGLAQILQDPNKDFSIIIYPQGTRFEIRTDEKGRRLDGDLFVKGPGLKAGAFYAALRSGAPLVPMTWNGMGPVMPSGFHRAMRGQRVEVVISRPIDPKALRGDVDHEKDRSRMIEELANRVEREYRAHFRAPLLEPQIVQQLSREVRLKRAQDALRSGKHNVSLNQLTRVRAHATALTDGATPQQHNPSRAALNAYLDFFHFAVQAEIREAVELRNFWLSSRSVDRDYFDALFHWLEETGELRGVLARHSAPSPLRVSGLFGRFADRP